MDNLTFAISATTREQRIGEMDGRDYYFITNEEFKELLAKGAFVEYEEVYPGIFYGTLYNELSRLWELRHRVIFDVDVNGGISLKKKFGDDALLIFIMPPSIEALEQRLLRRGTESPQLIAQRLAKAQIEMSYASHFDRVIINDNLERAIEETSAAIEEFFTKPY